MAKQVLFSVTKKDLEVTWYCSPGPGGQKKNKTMNACRIKHPDSGAMVTAQERKERSQNQAAALHRLVEHPKFKLWMNKGVWEIDHELTVEKYVEQQMHPKNVKVEILNEKSQWVPLDTSKMTDCPRCHGSGEGRPDHRDYKPAKQRERICLECNGTGFVQKND